MRNAPTRVEVVCSTLNGLETSFLGRLGLDFAERFHLAYEEDLLTQSIIGPKNGL